MVTNDLLLVMVRLELFDLPEGERQDRVLGLLHKFVTEKHNGFVTRLNNGQEDAVLSQVSRCLDLAITLDNESSSKTFENLRHKRTTGRYKRLIQIEPILLGNPESVTTASSLLSTLFSVPPFEDNLTLPLPDKLIQQIKQKAGRRKIDGFITKFVNLLYFARQDNSFLHLPRKELSDRKIIPASPNKFAQHVRILVGTEVIDKEAYRAKTRATGYRLREEERQLIDNDRLNRNMPSEGG
jgi:hypothetical protein